MRNQNSKKMLMGRSAAVSVSRFRSGGSGFSSQQLTRICLTHLLLEMQNEELSANVSSQTCFWLVLGEFPLAFPAEFSAYCKAMGDR